jgi:hypothetical protein
MSPKKGMAPEGYFDYTVYPLEGVWDIMEEFAGQENLIRKSKVHREIYLSDARKEEPEKLKTVLRFEVENK